MKTEILKLLRESTEYISGQELCEHFNVSRTAVWKVINQLKEEGYQIEAVRNRGYHIVECPDILSREEIESQMQTAWAGRSVVCFEETDSTNNQIKKLAEAGAVHGTLAVADMQKSGKGRRGRNWESPKGKNIYMSILLRPEMNPSMAPQLTLVMALSVAQAMVEAEKIDARIKWPNDIVLNKKKICGILTEMNTEIDYINHVVIGIGINVNDDAIPKELQEKATSMMLEEKHRVQRSTLIANIMKCFEQNYETFAVRKDLSFMQEAYNEILVNCNQEVTIIGTEQQYHAVAKGINATGELIVERDDGTIEEIYSGEVSVRGIYGYV
ncbi:MAG: biotin--[acetyl-CoA-carboxylase] ligase [Hespellia sp.]|nr:biotin--[acetyl-CoA-carboxylase] ligase [Hespellia sp.]